MPHTNRKKKTVDAVEKKQRNNIVQPMKRIQVVDGDGWVHVVGGGKKAGDGAAWTHAGDFERDGVAYIHRTVEEMRGDFEYYRKQWESSEAGKQLKEILKGRKGVKNVVCLGLGSLQSARREGRRSSFTQLAALCMILEELGRCCLELWWMLLTSLLYSRRRFGEDSVCTSRPSVYGYRQGVFTIAGRNCGG
jgi:hypothetical protein